jgi:hypothetical protein
MRDPEFRTRLKIWELKMLAQKMENQFELLEYLKDKEL